MDQFQRRQWVMENEWVNWHQRACSEGLERGKKGSSGAFECPDTYAHVHTSGSWGTWKVLSSLKEWLHSPSSQVTARNKLGSEGESDTPKLGRWWKQNNHCNRRAYKLSPFCLEQLGRKWEITSWSKAMQVKLVSFSCTKISCLRCPRSLSLSSVWGILIS